MLSMKLFHVVITALSISCILTFTFLNFVSATVNSSSDASISVQNNDPVISDPGLKVEKVLDGLYFPTSVSFLGNNDYIVLQKNGTVNRVVNGNLIDKPLLNLNVASGLYQGLLGSAVLKNATSDSTYVFLFYTEANSNNISDTVNSSASKLGNKVYRYELVDNNLTNPKMLLQLPSYPGPDGNGGYMTIGPDNNLYIIIGNVMHSSNETIVQTLTQNFRNGSDPDGRSGILRITPNGDPVLNHNETRGILGSSYPLNLYYAYGIHNGFGLAFDPVTGHLWDTETGHGFLLDELNLVLPGFNSGFGVIQGLSKFFPNAVYNLVTFNGSGKYSDPEFTWMQKVVPTGLVFLDSNKLGDKYQNDLLVGTFNTGKIYRFDLNENRTELLLPPSLQSKVMLTHDSTGSDEIEFGSGFNGISSLVVGPDGYLYVVSITDGAIYKISPK